MLCRRFTVDGGARPYPWRMLEARRVGLWRNRYEIIADGQPLAMWDGRVWRSGGTFDLAGRRYDVKSNVWGTRSR